MFLFLHYLNSLTADNPAFPQLRYPRLSSCLAAAFAFLPIIGCTIDDGADQAQVGEIESASTVGGTVSRSETLTRAQHWVDLHIMYSQQQSNAAADGDGHSYRPDCSG